MLRVHPRHAWRLVAAACAVGCASSIGALAMLNTDAMLVRAFERPVEAEPAVPVRVARDEPATHAVPGGPLWLTREGARSASPGAALIGERLTLAIDGGKQMAFEVVSVAEIAPLPHAPSGERLVMVTCREVAESEQMARLVRLIVDADTPLSIGLSRPGHRTL